MSLKNCFSKKIRLNNSKIIREVFEHGVYRSLGPIGVKFKNSESESSRFSISIKKKVGIAPFRNKIKRLIKEAVRLEKSQLNCSYDICFFVTNPSSTKIEFEFIRNKVKHFFGYLNIELLNRVEKQ